MSLMLKAALSKGPFGVTDPNFSSVVLLAHMDGSNGGTTFTDNSLSAKALTANSATTSTTQVKFGTASGFFNGTGGYVSSATSTDFAFPGDFTIEFWAWKSANNSNGFDCVATTDTTNGSGINGWGIELSASRGFVFFHNGSIIISAALNPNDSTWHHWAVSRTGSALSMYKDGVSIATATSSASILATGAFGIGRNINLTAYPFNGYIDDMRITKGVGRYPSAFTPPSAAFPNS